MKSFKSKELTITFSALLLCCAVLSLGISIALKINEVQHHWKQYTHSSSKAAMTLSQIHHHLGFGGTIHQLKNTALSPSQLDVSDIEKSVLQLEKTVSDYSSFIHTEQETHALQDLQKIIAQYQYSLSLIKQFQESQLQSLELESFLSVDENKVRRALKVLDNAASARGSEMVIKADYAFDNIVNHLILGVLIIPTIIIFSGFLIAFLRKLALTNRRLIETHHSLDTLFEAVPDALITADKSGQLLRVNKQALDLFGYSQTEFLQLNIEDLMPQRFRKHHVDYRSGYFRDPKPRAMENSNMLFISTKSGQEIPVEISLSNLQENGEYIAVASIRDISTRKAQDEIIRASQSRLAEAQRIAKLGSWSINFQTNETIWSDEVYAIFKLDKDRCKASLETYLSFTCPSEVDELQKIITSLRSEDNSYNLIRKLCFTDGTECYVREEGEVCRDDSGKVIRALGTIRDITEAVKTREKLEQAAVVFEHTSDAVLITNTQHKIVAINRAYSKISGYSETEAIGQDAGFTKSGQHAKDFYIDMQQQLAESGSWQGEIWDRRKDGEIYPKWLSINSVKNDRGTLLYYVGVFTDISHIKSTEDKLRHLALHDSLTGLPNRLSFNEQLDHAIKSAQRNQVSTAVLFLDLDRFKTINDSLGHPIGDALLIEVASRLRGCLRADDTIARLGGDEFTIIMEDILIPEDAAKVAEKINQTLSAPVSIDGHQFYVTTSIGISLFPEDGKSVTELVKNADSAMYRAKESGRNCYEFYSSELATAAVTRLELEGDLRRAISNDEFALHYQPQFNLQTGAITGAEALIRWHHPERGLISPDKFIPIAEETGLINQIGEYALFKACHQLKRWHQKGWMLPKVSVNVAGKQIYSGQLLSRVEEALKVTGISASCLEIELTETTLMQSTEKTINTLLQLRKMGVQISIDDFGTGYSSLSYLKTLPIHRIKIDRSFVQDIPGDTNDVAITKAIIALSKNLQLDVIAEGLESEEQKLFLLSEDCMQAQGFLFSKPLPPRELYNQFKECKFLLSHSPVTGKPQISSDLLNSHLN